MDEPKFKNSSDARAFLAHFQDHDLYFDPQMGIPTIIARFGDAAPDYLSGLGFADTNPVIAEGKRLAVERGLLLVPDGLDLELTTWTPMSYPSTLVPYLATRRFSPLHPDEEKPLELRLQRWPWSPYDAAGWRWDLIDPNNPYETRAFGYMKTEQSAEFVASSVALAVEPFLNEPK